MQLQETQYVILSIEFHQAPIFLEPGKTYTIKIAQMDYNESREINPLINAENLQLEIVKPDQDDLNIVIGDFNGMYNSFLLEHFNALYRDKDKSLLDSLRRMILSTFGEVYNPYFRTYAAYKIAALEQLTQAMTQSQIASEYFIGKPIRYANLEYMDFFNNFFTKYITVTSKILKYTDYRKILDGPDPYYNLLRTLAKDTILKDSQLRELVLLKGMMELYNSPDFNKDAILRVISTAGNVSPFLENREVASDIWKVLSRLKPGTEAPAFSLPDRNHNMVSLSSFHGKPVLLCFWTTYCQGCLSELDLMIELYKRFGSRIHFISISSDREFIKMMLFITRKDDYKWTFLHAGEQLEILKDYDVRSYPLFVLIDQEGNILKYPVEYPSKGLEKVLETILAP
jgi:peroxiredoxin